MLKPIKGGGVPTRKLPVRPVAPRKSASIAMGSVDSASGAVTPRPANGTRVKGLA